MVKVKFFAVLKKIAGKDELTVDIHNQKITLGQLIGQVERDLPQVRDIVKDGKVLVSINQEMAREEDLVKDGDEIAFLPPFAGG
jgi:molybdopterin converting factor subunit 1